MIKDIVSFLLGLFEGVKKPFQWLGVIIILLLIGCGVWGYERMTSTIYLSKLERKVSLIEKLQIIKNSDIVNSPELNKIYLDTVKELESFNVSQPLINQINLGEPSAIGKAISGALLWIIVFIYGVISEAKKAGKVTGMIVFLGVVLGMIAIFFAWLGTIIPTIINPWINIIGFPIIQILILILLSRKGNVRKTI